MAKKLQAARNTRPLTAAARRTQPVLLRPQGDVTANSANDENGGPTGKSATAVVAAPMAKRTAPAVGARSNTANKTKTPTTPSNPARTAAALRAGKSSARAAGQAMLRRPMIRAENFGYVIKDLQLIAIIAVVMFIFMIVLHFILPA
jgi:hypothetical protein